MIEVSICDMTVTHRTVELPDKCPTCGSDLSEVHLKVWEYQDQTRTYMPATGDWPDLPEGGDNTLVLSYQCGECDAELARGKQTEADEQ